MRRGGETKGRGKQDGVNFAFPKFSRFRMALEGVLHGQTVAAMEAEAKTMSTVIALESESSRR